MVMLPLPLSSYQLASALPSGLPWLDAMHYPVLGALGFVAVGLVIGIVAWRRSDPASCVEEPIRGELFNLRQLQAHAVHLARTHTLTSAPDPGRPLSPQLERCHQVLDQAYRTLTQTARRRQPISPAAEWLLDNYYLIEQQIEDVQRNLPRRYYRELPKLTEGERAGYPRIYDMALELISHTHGRLDVERLTSFVQAYQPVSQLSIGELWALPLVIRAGLLEDLRRSAAATLAAHQARGEANALADNLAAHTSPDKLTEILAQRMKDRDEFDCTFAAQLLYRLRTLDAETSPALRWLEEWLEERGTSAEEIIEAEHRRQAANQVAVGNDIASLRLVSTMDWSTFFERTSLVEQILHFDPIEAFGQMDFATRDRYRDVVEQLAKRTEASEVQVARRAREEADAAYQDDPSDQRRAHVGYYLVGEGRRQLEAQLGYRPTRAERWSRLAKSYALVIYLGAIGGVTSLTLAVLLACATLAGVSPAVLTALAVVGLVPCSTVGVGMTNWLVSILLPPRTLPKLDFSEGVPPSCRTMVVVPAMLFDRQGIERLLEHLEIRYLANRDPNVHFALLTDFADAPEAEMPEDAELLKVVGEGIRRLNALYTEGKEDRFYLFHRQRRWNPQQGSWMGWERKWGKLTAFNSLVLGEADTDFVVQIGDLSVLPEIRYVITLDADTHLPPNSAHRLIGAIAHPLNRARFDPIQDLVTAGYAIVQPRISATLSGAARSLFARVYSGPVGLDPYTRAVSDAYQDLFGEGSYVGKGIYDVEAFQTVLEGRFPENALLSHDLIEGCYARTALASKIELLDDHPASYISEMTRQHRWTRGDWQLLPWLLLPRVRDGHGRRIRNTLSALSRWKLLDNLRRSLVPITTLALLGLGWTTLPRLTGVWSGLVVLMLAFPVCAHIASALLTRARSSRWVPWLLDLWERGHIIAAQVALSIVFMAHSAALAADAIVRTLVRLTITRRKLLEWEPSFLAELRLQTGFGAFWHYMWPASGLAGALLALILLAAPAAWPAASPFLALWAASPAVAYWLSRDRPHRKEKLPPAATRDLRRTARKTWRFFETFVGPDDNWLPPDNYQEDPKGVVAHRTSPTNIGLLLLSTLAAHDLGYLTLSQLADRLDRTLSTLEGLERYRGHFYNWYETQSLEPLPPRYISTVDSGNLAGHLLTLKQGLVEIVDQPVVGGETLQGLRDTVAMLREEVALARLPNGKWAAKLDRLTHHLDDVPDTPTAWLRWLETLKQETAPLPQLIEAPRLGTSSADPGELRHWATQLVAQVRSLDQELQSLTSWASLVDERQLPIALQEGTSSESGRHVPLLVGLAGEVPSLGRLMARLTVAAQRFPELETSLRVADMEAEERERVITWLNSLRGALERSRIQAIELLDKFYSLIRRVSRMVGEMEFDFLFDEQRQLFSIGYSVERGTLDASYYDLLASEARLTSFLAIAKGDVNHAHWFHLSRPLTTVGRRRALLSWSGTMFEYLMPPLVMEPYEFSLLEQTYHAAVQRHRQYAALRHIPWGLSESGYAALDRDLNYQYRAFGAPGLSLRRETDQNLVVSPYAAILAVDIEPRAVIRNLARLAREGAEGKFGFYEAVDYTPTRVPEGQRSLIVRSYMAHHQGMSLVALVNCLQDGPMRRRFHAEPLVQANALLLQERVPKHAVITHPYWQEGVTSPRVHQAPPPPTARRLTSPDTPTPHAHFLSNGAYSVMVTSAGAGYSACHGLAVTRWRGDATRDHWGMFIYIRDLDRGEVWSVGFQPTRRQADEYEIVYREDKVIIRRYDSDIETQTEIAVSPEDDAEVRRITLTNRSRETRRLEVTSYAEVVLAPMSEDTAHPAFGNLHIETEFLPGRDALICRRRPRSADEAPAWGMHLLAVEGWVTRACQFETDRARFLGRGRTPAAPAAVCGDGALSNTVGAVLDPIVSLRQSVVLEAGGTAQISFVTGVGPSREQVVALADKYHDPRAIDRTLALAKSRSRLQRRYLGLSGEQILLFQRLASRVVFPDPSLQADPALKSENTKGQSDLWSYGISGDLPFVLVRVGESEEVDLVRQLLLAHRYWREQGLRIDLVILNEHPHGYAHALQEKLRRLVDFHRSQFRGEKRGDIFLLPFEQLAEGDLVLLQAAARVVLVGAQGTLVRQLEHEHPARSLPDMLTVQHQIAAEPPASLDRPALEFPNGIGGFRPDGEEYVILLEEDRWSPAPWINVVANSQFGFLVSEAGSGYTWSENSREHRLTPWANDSVSDPPGEALYLRDEESGAIWTPTPLPIREPSPYLVRHGQGYTVFQHTSHGLVQELLLLVPPDDPVKICRLRIRNLSDRQRRLSATHYIEWVLGVTREQMQHHITTEVDAATGALLARSAYGEEFAGRIAFADVNREAREFTGDRTEFLGRNGAPDDPAALHREALSGQVGAGLDPCAALQVALELGPGEEEEVIFLLGDAESIEHARWLMGRYRRPDQVQRALDAVRAFWERLLSTVQVETPDRALDLMLNRWLLYQTLSCRIWARSALYQSGGAYGFRDQLQDVMALVYAAPSLAREHILRAAAHQFEEGDVQHWWHPPSGRGVRTRFSDDLLWLPFVTAHYVRTTGDADILNEEVSFLHAAPLAPEQESSYGLPEVSDQAGSLYEHCLRALDRSLAFGRHGLPLMGSGDWNDGMNRVGFRGQGESVWLGWFLHTNLTQFASICESLGDEGKAEQYRQQAERLRQAIETEAWDGAWYRRAYFDDGTPLGSAQNDECKIDSIAQSWAVISGAADTGRERQAMEAVEEHLIWRDAGLMPIFTPPFDQTTLDPGYIKGYVPGVRENGGQYTHAALWTVQAFAQLGDGDRAVELLRMLNPIRHALTESAAARYRVEPYVVAADIYSAPDHVGRGGWSWYTGSAGWMYRVGLESILGLQLRGSNLTVDPCICRDWSHYKILYRHGDTTYHITVENPEGVQRGVRSVEMDSVALPSAEIPLVDDGRTHQVRVLLGS